MSGAPRISSMRLWRLKDYLRAKLPNCRTAELPTCRTAELIDARVSGAGYTPKDTFTSDRINGNIRYIAIWGTPLGVVVRAPRPNRRTRRSRHLDRFALRLLRSRFLLTSRIGS